MSHAGALMVSQLADRVGLTEVLSTAMAPTRRRCNTVFALAIDAPPPPRIRPAIGPAREYRSRIVAFGVVLGCALASAAIVVPRLNTRGLFALTLGAVLAFMLISFVAVPAGIIGLRRQRLPPKQAVIRLAAGGALSAIAMTPGLILDRIGLILLGVRGLHIIGFVLLSLGTALYAAGMSSVKAVKMTMKLTDIESQASGCRAGMPR